MRGVWMHATQIKTAQEADGCVKRIDRARLNAVFLLVWYWGGQAFYRSELCPMGEGVEEGYDPLGYMIRECHRRQIEVHAWFVNGAYGADRPRHVLDAHPEWAVDAGPGAPLWYDFGKPEVRKFQSDLMIECLKGYDLDGIHFDYIRYGPTVCYCRHCQEEFARRFGHAPLGGGRRDCLPVAVTLHGNPLAGPTTAEVLAEFSDGTPAIALNKLGQGEVLLLNWHAEREMPPPVAETVRRALRGWEAARQGVIVMNTAPNRAVYGQTGTSAAVRLLAAIGYQAKAIGEDRLGEVPGRATLVLSTVYIIPTETAAELARFVEQGGRLLVIDGPVRSIRDASLQRLLGMARSGRYFSRMEVLRSSGRSRLVPADDRTIDLEKEKRRGRDWAEFRKWGVSQLVRDVYRRAKAAKPQAQITAAVFTPLASAESVYQDWPGWLREGIIDYVIPMAYTSDNERLAEQLEEWKAVDPRLQRIVPGLSIYRRTQSGTVTRELELVGSQHRMCVEQGASGNVYFSLNYLSGPLIEMLRGEFYRSKVPAYRPPARSGP